MSRLTKLNNKVFTIINQIPSSPTVATKTAWKKFRLENCKKDSQIRDASGGTMAFKLNTWTAYIYDMEHYKSPNWLEDGYYTLIEDEPNANIYTVAVGDLLVFADIPDAVPTTLQEFNALRDKYKDVGGIINDTAVCDALDSRTNHIEAIKG